MDQNTLVNGLITYLGLVVLLTFHEFGHAWTAWKCGDDTARLQGRVSLNPLVHIDPIGTVLLPLLMLLVPGAGRFMVGWAKPVPVNLNNLPNPRVDDVLITAAGPLMNLILAVALMALARAGLTAGSLGMADICVQFAYLSLLLCFFNLIPIPPLDGSRVLRVLIGMSYEAYQEIARYGMVLLILVLQVPQVRAVISYLTDHTGYAIGKIFGLS
jgi:Zn-dependent protease